MVKFLFVLLLPFLADGTEECNGYVFNSYPLRYLPIAAHQLQGVSSLGDSVELEDGSVWKISRYDSPSALTFRSDDILIITQNHRWFSQYNYRIINQQTGIALEANLFLGPQTNNQYTWYVTAIDRIDGDLILTNGFGQPTRWEISWHDESLFQNWAVNDAVIIGQNTGWDSRSESLLINVNMDQSVRARQR